MGKIWDKFYYQEPQKYYQPLDYNKQIVKDMLSNKDNNYIAEQKFDGEWARAIIDNDTVVIQSRSISKVTGEYGDKTALVPHIVEELKSFPNGTVILGELCFADETLTSKDVGAILRCKPEKAIARQKDVKLIFRTFDCLATEGKEIYNFPYENRFCVLLSILGNLTYVKPPVFAINDDCFEDFLQDILIAGGEGIVIHSKGYVYTPGKRPAWQTLKVKKITKELELPVVDLINPKEHYEGTAEYDWQYYYSDMPNANSQKGDYPVTKAFFYGWKNGVVVDNNGTKVRVTSGLTDEDRQWLATDEAAKMLANKQLVAVVSAMEVTEDGSLRHPRLIRIRTDI